VDTNVAAHMQHQLFALLDTTRLHQALGMFALNALLAPTALHLLLLRQLVLVIFQQQVHTINHQSCLAVSPRCLVVELL
jgi:hypothetical protein